MTQAIELCKALESAKISSTVRHQGRDYEILAYTATPDVSKANVWAKRTQAEYKTGEALGEPVNSVIIRKGKSNGHVIAKVYGWNG